MPTAGAAPPAASAQPAGGAVAEVQWDSNASSADRCSRRLRAAATHHSRVPASGGPRRGQSQVRIPGRITPQEVAAADGDGPVDDEQLAVGGVGSHAGDPTLGTGIDQRACRRRVAVGDVRVEHQAHTQAALRSADQGPSIRRPDLVDRGVNAATRPPEQLHQYSPRGIGAERAGDRAHGAANALAWSHGTRPRYAPRTPTQRTIEQSTAPPRDDVTPSRDRPSRRAAATPRDAV